MSPPVICGRSGAVVPRMPTTGACVGRSSPGTRFPYSSPTRFAAPGTSGGGTAAPKLPRGMGVPPFFSNFVILSRKLFTLFVVVVLPVGDKERAGEGDTEGGGDVDVGPFGFFFFSS